MLPTAHFIARENQLAMFKMNYTEQKSAAQRKLRELAQRWIDAHQISLNNDVSIIVKAAAFFEKNDYFPRNNYCSSQYKIAVFQSETFTALPQRNEIPCRDLKRVSL
jgi:hypothetical protein